MVVFLRQTAFASTDNTAPICTGFQLKKTSIIKPNYLTISVSFKENGTGINCIRFFVQKKGVPDSTYSNVFYWHEEITPSYWDRVSMLGTSYSITEGLSFLPNRKLYNETVDFDLYVGDYADPGDYFISGIHMEDTAGNQNYCIAVDNAHEISIGNSITFMQSNNGAVNSCYDPSFTAKPWFAIYDEYDYQFEESLSNPNIRNDVKTIDDGKSMKLLADSSTVIPKEAFDAIKGKNSRIVVYNDKYQWIFYGKDIKKETKDVDTAVSYEKVGWSAYNTFEDACILRFKNNGILPGKAEVRIASEYAYNLFIAKHGLLLYFLHNNIAELQNSANIKTKQQYDKKWCSFEISHNSDYLLSGSAVNSKKQEERSTSAEPPTPAPEASTVTNQQVDPITIIKVPASVKAKAKKAKVTISWKKIKKSKKTKALLAQIQSIQVQVATDQNFEKIVVNRNIGKKKVKLAVKLQRKTQYYVRVRYVGNGGFSPWSAVKGVRTK